MPRNPKISAPPQVMTWGGAALALIIAVITDALKIMFEWLIFFGPALAGLYCTVKTGSDTAGAVCTTAAGVASFFGAAAIEPFGIIMAMAIAFIGWLIVGFWILAKNRRIFKANATGSLWLSGSLALGLVPFLGTLPFLTGTLVKLYRTQIKVEKAAYKRWEKETAEARQLEQQRALQALQMQQMQATQTEALQETANDEQQGVEQENEVLGGNTTERETEPSTSEVTPYRLRDRAPFETFVRTRHEAPYRDAVAGKLAEERRAGAGHFKPRAEAPLPNTATDGVSKVMYRGTGAEGAYPKEGSVMYVSPSEEFASERAAFLHKEKATTHAVRVRVKNTFDYENEDHIARLNAFLAMPASFEERFKYVMELNPDANPTDMKALLQQMAPGVIKGIRRGEWSTIESPHVKRAIQKLGFDSFYIKEARDGKSYKNMGVFDASKVAAAEK